MKILMRWLIWISTVSICMSEFTRCPKLLDFTLRSHVKYTDCYVNLGSMNSDYQTISTRDYKEVNAYTATGSSSSVLAARVSYVFNLHGPCLTLDTACSSALIAVHLGSQAIRSGKCELKWIPRILWSHVLARH